MNITNARTAAEIEQWFKDNNIGCDAKEIPNSGLEAYTVNPHSPRFVIRDKLNPNNTDIIGVSSWC